YFSSRGDIENFYCYQNESQVGDFISTLSKANTGGSLIALPGPDSPTSSYVEVIDFGDHYSFTIVTAVSAVKYRLSKSNGAIKEMERRTPEQNNKSDLEVIK